MWSFGLALLFLDDHVEVVASVTSISIVTLVLALNIGGVMITEVFAQLRQLTLERHAPVALWTQSGSAQRGPDASTITTREGPAADGEAAACAHTDLPSGVLEKLPHASQKTTSG